MNYYPQKLIDDKAEKFYVYQNSSEIFELIIAFENCTLPRERWTHSAYLTVVIWYLYMGPLPEAHRLISNSIRRYNFEHNIITNTGSNILMPMLVRVVKDYLKQNRGADSFVELVNGLFRHFAGEKRKENNPKQKFHPANSMRARSNVYEFISH